MSTPLAIAWKRRGRALAWLKRRDRGSSALSPRECIEWMEDALRLAREQGTLREEDPADPSVLRRRRRIHKALAMLRT